MASNCGGTASNLNLDVLERFQYTKSHLQHSLLLQRKSIYQNKTNTACKKLLNEVQIQKKLVRNILTFHSKLTVQLTLFNRPSL